MKNQFVALVLGATFCAVLSACSTSGSAVRNGPQALNPVTGVADYPAAAASAASETSATEGVAKTSDACGASQFQSLVGGPSSATFGLDIPGSSRHYGREERVATDTPTRLNFVHSGTAVDAVTNPNATVIRVFCG